MMVVRMYALGQEGLGLYKPGGQGKMCITPDPFSLQLSGAWFLFLPSTSAGLNNM
jgi:hypothetical protein